MSTNSQTEYKETDTDTEQDILAGKAKQVEGKFQQGFGKITDDKSEQTKGWAKEQHGKVQEGVGEVKDSLDGKNDGR